MAKQPTQTEIIPDDLPPPADDQSYAEPVADAAPEPDAPEPAEREVPVAKIHRRRQETIDRIREREKAAETETVEPTAELEPSQPETMVDDRPAEPEAKKFKLKVNHQALEMTEEEVIAAAQQHLAATDALPEVKRLRAELMTTIAELRNSGNNAPRDASAHQPAAQDSDPAHTNAPAGKTDDHLREIVNGLQIGDVDEGVEALKSLIDDMKQENPAVSRDEIASQAIAEIKRELAAEVANATFQGKYPEVYNDRRLAAATVMTINDLCLQEMYQIGVKEADLRRAQANPELIPDWHRQYRQRGYPVSEGMELASRAAVQVQDDFRRILVPVEAEPAAYAPPAQQPGSTMRTEARTAEKRFEQNNNPRRASVPARQAPQAQKTTADVVAEMRRARHLARG